MREFVIYSDGGYFRRTGKAYGSIAVCHNNEVIFKDRFSLDCKDSSEAEYLSFIFLLERIQSVHSRNDDIYYHIRIDSRLIEQQMKNKYEVNDPNLKRLNNIAKEIYSSLTNVDLTWVKRKEIVKILGH